MVVKLDDPAMSGSDRFVAGSRAMLRFEDELHVRDVSDGSAILDPGIPFDSVAQLCLNPDAEFVNGSSITLSLFVSINRSSRKLCHLADNRS